MRDRRAQISRVVQIYRKQFGQEPQYVVRSPGRINLIGEHIDYHGGVVLPAAIGLANYIAIGRSDETAVYATLDETTYRPQHGEMTPWSPYLQQLEELAREEDLTLYPYRAVIDGDLPAGAGLSSSASLCTGFIMGLDHIHGWELDRVEMAYFAQSIEHAEGVMCGIMDQMAVLQGRQGHVVRVDCSTDACTAMPARLDPYEIMLLDSGVTHELADTAYNERRQGSLDALQLITHQYAQVQHYREVTAEMIARAQGLSDEQQQLATYVMEEMTRVDQAVEHLGTGDMRSFGSILNASHAGLRDLYRVTCRETDILAELCQSHPEIVGARQVGGGFGGCILTLVHSSAAAAAREEICQKYQALVGRTCLPIEIEIADGVEFFSSWD